jgi:hypothetical protein
MIGRTRSESCGEGSTCHARGAFPTDTELGDPLLTVIRLR